MKDLELKEYLANYDLEVNDEQVDLLIKYMDYVLLKNEEINLTAIKSRDEYISLMIIDSALPLRLTDFHSKKILDIGTGAGYPGTVIDILTNSDITLLDSTKKKLEVIKGFIARDFKVEHARAEEYASNHREAFDIVIARAVSDLSIIMELALPLVKVDGYFIAMKGRDALSEIKRAKNAFDKLGAKLVKVDELNLPTGEVHNNLLIKKIKSTPNKYPRSYNDIKKKPL